MTTVHTAWTTDPRLEKEFEGGQMAIEDLMRLSGELEELAHLLKSETRTQARWIIMQRIHEIILTIGEGIKE